MEEVLTFRLNDGDAVYNVSPSFYLQLPCIHDLTFTLMHFLFLFVLAMYAELPLHLLSSWSGMKLLGAQIPILSECYVPISHGPGQCVIDLETSHVGTLGSGLVDIDFMQQKGKALTADGRPSKGRAL